MMVSDLIARVRLDVNDLDSDRWQDSHIIDVINEGFCELFNVRPDLFHEIVVTKLDEGEWQQPCCCALISKLDGISDNNGVKIADIREVEQSASVAMGKVRRCNSSAYPSEYGLDKANGSRFWVNPPIRPNQHVFVRVLCAVRPEKLGFDVSAKLNKVGCEFYGALVDFVLFRLLGSETESMTSREKSAFHRSAFYEKLSIHQGVRRVFQSKEGGQK